MRILKIGSCASASGKSEITYHIGYSDEAEICFRVYANTGNGYFSTEWITYTAIKKTLEEGHKPLTSFALYSLYAGKSVNTPAFLNVALKNEGLLIQDPEHPRCYAQASDKAFIAEIKSLAEGNVDIKPSIPKQALKKNTSRPSGE
jgi:hypothetical protein